MINIFSIETLSMTTFPNEEINCKNVQLFKQRFLFSLMFKKNTLGNLNELQRILVQRCNLYQNCILQLSMLSLTSLLQIDFTTMCENAITYNKPETIYHKAARKLLHSGMKILSKVHKPDPPHWGSRTLSTLYAIPPPTGASGEPEAEH